MEESQFNKFKEGKIKVLLPKRPKNTAWFKKKLMLAKAKEAGQILDEEQLAFLADTRTDEAPFALQKIPHNPAFQTEELDAYDSDCGDLSSAKVVLMDVQEMSYSEQTHIDDYPDNDIHSDRNIIPYS
nr:hypothetical protein [Tanacetum cinerariifolium]